MSGSVFVDTNVLVYARDRTDEDKQRRALEWMTALWDEARGRTSVQVLQEYYVTLTRKLDPPRSAEEAREDVVALGVWDPVLPDLAILERGWNVEDRYGLSWWDALIVAAALGAGARWLLTEDLQDGQDLFGLTVVDPFRHTPEEILGGP